MGPRAEGALRAGEQTQTRPIVREQRAEGRRVPQLRHVGAVCPERRELAAVSLRRVLHHQVDVELERDPCQPHGEVDEGVVPVEVLTLFVCRVGSAHRVRPGAQLPGRGAARPVGPRDREGVARGADHEGLVPPADETVGQPVLVVEHCEVVLRVAREQVDLVHLPAELARVRREAILPVGRPREDVQQSRHLRGGSPRVIACRSPSGRVGARRRSACVGARGRVIACRPAACHRMSTQGGSAHLTVRLWLSRRRAGAASLLRLRLRGRRCGVAQASGRPG